jgi:2-desacetyl-2-hydroxyethyl bacteriochlorophyllide A dehydrogenase
LKVAKLIAPRNIIVDNAKVPTPKATEVLIEIKASGICGSDITSFLGKHPSMKYPTILGHETSGIVSKVGKNVKNRHEGDKVAVDPMLPCGKCFACKEGSPQICIEAAIIGRTSPGVFAEYVAVPVDSTYVLPDDISFEEAALMDALTTAMHAIRKAEVDKKDFVVILGSGRIGLLAIQLLKNVGAKVLATDLKDYNLSLAKFFGADITLNPINENLFKRTINSTNYLGADIIFEYAGNTKTISQTVDLTRKGGKIILVGWTGREYEQMNMTKVTLNEISILGSRGHTKEDFSKGLELISKDNIQLKTLITHTFRLEDISSAFDLAASGEGGYIAGIIKP